MELWLPIAGFEGLYSVSNQGRIIGHKRHRVPERILAGSKAGNGYRKVILCKEDTRTHRYVHEIVLTTFAGPRPPEMDAAHGNGIRSDNRLSNLRWATRAGNHADKIAHGTHCAGERHGGRKLNAAEVMAIRNDSGTGASLAARFGVSQSQVQRIRSRTNWGTI